MHRAALPRRRRSLLTSRQPLIVLEGAPGYYARFGFEPAIDHGITLPLPDWAPPEAAQVLRLTNDDPALRGRVIYPASFDVLGAH